MNQIDSRDYYLSRELEIMDQFHNHAKAWKPFLTASYGDKTTHMLLLAAKEQMEAIIPVIPYIGGDGNPMTRHLVRSTTSLALYKAIKERGGTPKEAGKVIHDAVVTSVSKLPLSSFYLTQEFITRKKAEAEKSHTRIYKGDWVWEFVEGDGVEFDYGCDFLECGTQKLYHAHGADEFLPFYCYLDFATHRTTGWGFSRTMTLAEGHSKCDFRWKKNGTTRKGWPPHFVKHKP
ncbi:MAG: L-2-amino-thiazoline-4-carboxylic acid hydrolase [Firmicutes bacterium]|nr:L-2-amino-thiazoline-4-carboxylic acid hydrolase [Bacillota bacterium]